MASQGKRTGARDVVNIQSTEVTVSGTTKIYGSAPEAGRFTRVSWHLTEATDGAPAMTFKNETTGKTATFSMAIAAINTASTAALSAEVPVSRGDLISWVSDGAGSTGKAYFNTSLALENN